ncbi:MAG: SUMF1/EgtB/PvdO family nonheme iron enzyme, partial [Fibrobacteres bacterium]|nr:SUMF1/EgtB/PvdO family nonheme iron enzyme [Fibrobacterota bacterium]
TECVTPEGIYDLSGNVGEWVDNDMYTPIDTEIDDGRVLYRYSVGGAWASQDSSSVNYFERDRPLRPSLVVKRKDVGFRCCKLIE